MLNFFKRNKTFTVCLFLTIGVFISGILFNALIGVDTKKEITTNIGNMISYIRKEEISIGSILKAIFNNISIISLVWLSGMAVIGIPIVLFLYLLRVFMFGFELIAILSNLGFAKILFIIVYMFPKLLNLLIYFILAYYSINYSLVLCRLLFFKKSFNIKNITKRYIKVLLFCMLCTLVFSLLDSFIAIKILKLLI